MKLLGLIIAAVAARAAFARASQLSRRWLLRQEASRRLAEARARLAAHCHAHHPEVQA